MREIRQSGLEGGETNMLGLPYPIDNPPRECGYTPWKGRVTLQLTPVPLAL